MEVDREIIDMLKLLTSEFKMAKSQMRTDRNKSVQRIGEKLNSGQCSQEEYNFFVNMCNKDTEHDEMIIKKADKLIEKIS